MGEVIAEVEEEPVVTSRGENEGTSAHYSELQPAATSKEGAFIISMVTY